MKLHLPLALRSALLVVLCTASYAEVVTQNTAYEISQNVYSLSGNYVGLGDTPLYDLSFAGDRETLIDTPNSMGFALFENRELNISNIQNLTFKDFCLRSFSLDVTGDGVTDITVYAGAAINAGKPLSVSVGSNVELSGSISLANNRYVQFLNNESHSEGGGAIALNNSILTINDNENVLFDGNVAYRQGGAINSDNAAIYIQDNAAISFKNNEASDGGAICIGASTYSETCSLLFDSNKSIEFSFNTAHQGGAIYIGINSSEGFVFQNNVGDNSESDDADILFKENRSDIRGGAIYTEENLQFLDNGSISFIANEVGENVAANTTSKNSTNGGAICAIGDSSGIVFEGNRRILFQGNTTKWSSGGAIYSSGSDTGLRICDTSESVSFYQNISGASGGAIYSSSSNGYFNNNSALIFEENEATTSGGAISFSRCQDVEMSDNDVLKFINNNALLDGGAIYVNEGNTTDTQVDINKSGTLLFEGNISGALGGAIYLGQKYILNISNNTSVIFRETLIKSTHSTEKAFKSNQ